MPSVRVYPPEEQLDHEEAESSNPNQGDSWRSPSHKATRPCCRINSSLDLNWSAGGRVEIQSGPAFIAHSAAGGVRCGRAPTPRHGTLLFLQLPLQKAANVVSGDELERSLPHRVVAAGQRHFL